jgi:NTP pyrophosphatase (non-canonical NTP hydrolase)
MEIIMVETMKACPSFQARVSPWMDATFGPEISSDKLERNDRFIEEALELVQATDYPKERAHALVEYVYGRDRGEINQEVGGVMVTLAAHCLAHGLDMHEAGETELARIWTKVDQIRAKQAAKPNGSALPIAMPAHPAGGAGDIVERQVLRLVVMHDDGEHEPHEAEQCGIFPDLAGVHRYVARRFGEGVFEAVARVGGEAWHLVDRQSREDSDLVLIVWHETLYDHDLIQSLQARLSISEENVERGARAIAAHKRGLSPDDPEIDRVWSSYCGQVRACIASLGEE